METTSPELPEEGELLLTTVTQITGHGVYVSLDEYDRITGFLHISEIATGWVRNIDRYVRQDQKLVLKVIRVSKTRKEIDLSLRQVTGEEKKEKMIQVKKLEKAKGIMEIVRSKLSLSEKDSLNNARIISEEFGSLYEGLEEVVKKGTKILEKLNLPPDFTAMLEQVAKDKITIPEVQVVGVFSITSNSSDGILQIRDALLKGEEVGTGGAKIKISYLGSPQYRVAVRAENYKIAEKALEAVVNKVENLVAKSKGTFKFSRGEARK
jgi:translation initiation factor 2 subunit 1